MAAAFGDNVSGGRTRRGWRRICVELGLRHIAVGGFCVSVDVLSSLGISRHVAESRERASPALAFGNAARTHWTSLVSRDH